MGRKPTTSQYLIVNFMDGEPVLYRFREGMIEYYDTQLVRWEESMSKSLDALFTWASKHKGYKACESLQQALDIIHNYPRSVGYAEQAWRDLENG